MSAPFEETIETHSDTVSLVFRTDEAGIELGFNVSYKAIPYDTEYIIPENNPPISSETDPKKSSHRSPPTTILERQIALSSTHCSKILQTIISAYTENRTRKIIPIFAKLLFLTKPPLNNMDLTVSIL